MAAGPSGAGAPAAATSETGGAAMAAPPVAEAIAVSKRFGASQALDAVSMVVPAGDSRALVGRNGAGKSTLVGVLTGLLAADAGQVRLAGEPAPGLADRQRWRERVACVYQKSTVIPALTVAENLFLNAHPTFAGGLVAWPALRRRAEQRARGLGARGRCRPRRRASHGRAAADRRDRPRAAPGHPLHHPRRADRPARGPRGRPPVRAHRPPAGGRRHLPLHLAPSRGDLRGLPQRHRAARRQGGRQRAARRRCPRSAWSPPWSAMRSRGAAGRSRRQAPAAAQRAACLEVRGLCIEGAALRLELRGRRGRERRPRRARGLRQGGGRRCHRRPRDARLPARSASPARRCVRAWSPMRAARASATCRATATGAASCPSCRSPRT